MIPEEMVHCDKAKLPNAAGVLTALCSKKLRNVRSIVEVTECADIKKTVEENAAGWATHCDGYLEYWIFVSDDFAERQRVLTKAKQGRLLGE